MSDDGGRAPEPSDLGADWIEALLGDAPVRATPAPGAGPIAHDPAAEPLELGSAAMAEALLGPAPVRTPALDPEPSASPWSPTEPTAPGPVAPLPTRKPDLTDELLAPAPPVAPEPSPAPSWEAPAPLWDPSSAPRSEAPVDRAPVPHPPLEPPTPLVVPTAPSWAGDDLEPSSTWAPEPSLDTSEPIDLVTPPADEGWTLPSLARSVPAVPPEHAEPVDRTDQAGDGLTLPWLSGPSTTAEPPVGAPADDGWNLPPLIAPRPAAESPAPADEGSAHQGLPFLGLHYAPPAPEAEPSKASKSRKVEAARTDALVDPTSPSSPIVAGVGAALGANAAAAASTNTEATGSIASGSPFLDLRPKTSAPGAPPRKAAKGSGTGGHRRRHALIGVVAALVLVGGLVALQLSSDDDGGPDAVLTADAASIEADDEGSRGISVGVGEEEAAGEVEVDEAKADAADDATSDDGVVTGEDTEPADGDGGGTPATPGRLTVSASALDFGSGSGEVVSIRNEGGSPISWSASTSGAGFSVASARSGTLSAGQAANLSVAFSASGVAEGTARGTLTVSAGASRAVSLQAQVNRNPTISGVTWVSCGPTSRLRMNVSDESGVSKVEVAGTSPAGPGFRKTAVSQGSGAYRADIGPFSSNGQITYFVEATDSHGNVARSAVQYRGWNNGC